MEDLVFSFNLLILFAIAACVFALNYFLLRKYIFFWLDPLLIYFVFNSFSTAFVVYLYFWEDQIKGFYVITYALSSIGLLIGLIIGSKAALKKISNKIINTSVVKNYDQVFDVFMILSIFILISSNIAMLISEGTLPILSDNPSVAKVELYTGGWGLVRRIDSVLINFIFSIAFLKLFHPLNVISFRKKVFCSVCIVIAVFIVVTMGSKASLTGLLTASFGIFMINVFLGRKTRIGQHSISNLKKIKIFGKYAFIAALSYMFIVIVKTGVETTATNSFVTRLVGSGDTFYFFYVFDLYDYFKLGPLDFIIHIFNPVLGFFRIVPYEYPIGAYILYYAIDLPLSSFGPNSQHHIEGLLYFGKIGTFFYSFAIGFMIAQIRLSLLNIVLKKPDFLRLVIYMSFASIAVAAAGEIGYFFFLLYDLMIFGSILFLISLILTNYLKKNKVSNL
jgi:hypothetical protein